jgi:hypothetical protein
MTDSIVRLTVGGVMFETNMTTLLAEPDSSLAKMFTVLQMLPRTDPSGAYFIDSSPEHFGAVLNWCRFQKLMVGPDFDLAGLLVVADYFGLLELVGAVTRRQDEEQKTVEVKQVLATERHKEIMSALDWITARLPDRVSEPDRPRGPRTPPNFPWPDPDIPRPDYN